MRITAFFLMTCFFMSTIGYHFVFRVQVSRQKMQMKRSLRQSRSRDHILDLTFNADEARKLQWEGDDEFSWKGEMYDVVSKKVENGKLLITCISDKEEERLLEEYQARTEQNQNRTKNSLAKLLTGNFVNSEPFQLPTCTFFIKRIFFDAATALLFRSSAIISPPPKVC